jgi:cytochrome b561
MAARPRKIDSPRNGKDIALQRYSPLQAALHWASAALILFSLIFGTLVLKFLPNDAAKITPLRAHMIIGGVIGMIVVARLVLRFGTRQPDRFKSGSAFLDAAAPIVHGALYVAVLGMVTSGIALAIFAGLPAIVFGNSGAALPPDFWQYPPRFIHALFSKILIVLVGLHVAAAVFHQFVRKDRLFQRMGFSRT